jgi:hypothetical protein
MGLQCRVNAWARWAVAQGPHEHILPHANLCVLCTARVKTYKNV